MMRRSTWLLAVLLAGCGLFGPAEDQRDWLNDAEARWAERGPASYTYTFRRGDCECLPSEPRPFLVRVVAGRAVDARDAETGDPAPAGFTLHTVPDLFAIVRDALDRNAAEFVVQYDPVLGYPTRISVDYERQVGDDEFTIRATGLQPIP